MRIGRRASLKPIIRSGPDQCGPPMPRSRGYAAKANPATPFCPVEAATSRPLRRVTTPRFCPAGQKAHAQRNAHHSALHPAHFRMELGGRRPARRPVLVDGQHSMSNLCCADKRRASRAAAPAQNTPQPNTRNLDEPLGANDQIRVGFDRKLGSAQADSAKLRIESAKLVWRGSARPKNELGSTKIRADVCPDRPSVGVDTGQCCKHSQSDNVYTHPRGHVCAGTKRPLCGEDQAAWGPCIKRCARPPRPTDDANMQHCLIHARGHSKRMGTATTKYGNARGNSSHGLQPSAQQTKRNAKWNDTLGKHQKR